jgi:hypothetical protein
VSSPAYPLPDGSGRVWIEYQRTGGIAAFDDNLVIYENRTAEATRRNVFPGTVRFTLNETAAAELNSLFQQARFLERNHLYPAPSPGADYFTYIVRYRGYEIRTEDTGVPTDLAPIIAALNRILEQGCGDDICPIP